MIMSSIDSRTMDCLVRMVVPMRREFGRNLDVSHFLHDTGYAREVLDHARQSRDQRLRDLAACVEKAMRGVRANAVVAPWYEPPQTAVAEPAAPDLENEALALKARIAKKYIAGLR
jgi:hypothetical protein